MFFCYASHFDEIIFIPNPYKMQILRFYMEHLSVVQIKTINTQTIEAIILQMKLLVITMLAGKELWPLLFNKICNSTNKIQPFYLKTMIITFFELSCYVEVRTCIMLVTKKIMRLNLKCGNDPVNGIFSENCGCIILKDHESQIHP